MNRAGFGTDVPFAKKYGDGSKMHELIQALFREHNIYVPLALPFAQPSIAEIRKMSQNKRKEYRDRSRDAINTLNISWLRSMEKNEQVFREKVSLFWHGHFACRCDHPAFVLSYINTIRRLALGNFRELLKAVSYEPAMLDFLNNRQNRKEHPNENFARELMELFTLGRGNYTENDVKEAARAFSGYTISGEGTFVVRNDWHDDGQKTILGKKGNFTGNDVIDILLGKKETAAFICRKIYKAFVNDSPDEARISELAEYFFKTDYNINDLFLYIFQSDWFYESKHYSALIKSPVELLVGLNRSLKLSYPDDKTMLIIQHMLGQVLFYPPNVAGWPGGKDWIDGSRLMTRMRLASLLLNAGEIDWNDGKNDAELTLPDALRGKIRKKFSATPDWDKFDQSFPGDAMIAWTDHFAGEMMSKTAREVIYTIREKSKKDQLIVLASLPEYQLC